MKKDNPLTVVVVFGNLGIGGVQSKIVDISKRIPRQVAGAAVHIILRDKTDFSFDKTLVQSGVSIHYRPVSAYVRIPFSLYFFWSVLVLRPHVILTFYDVLSSLAVIFKYILFWRNIRIVLNEDTFTSKHVITITKRWAIRAFYPLADRIIVPTRASKMDLSENFRVPPSLITVIPNWTIRSPQKKHFLRTGKKPYDMLFLGRFEKQKNLTVLLRATSVLQKAFPGLRVLMAGEGSEKSRLLKQIRMLRLEQTVVIQKTAQNVLSLLGQTKTFVLTSAYEGMSVALLEAMAAGVPAVAMYHPGIEEYVTNGKTGYIAKTEAQFIALLKKLLRSKRLRSKMSKAGTTAVRRNFSDGPLNSFTRYLIAVHKHV